MKFDSDRNKTLGVVLAALLGALGACGPDPRAENRVRVQAVLQEAGSTLFVDASTADHAAIRHTLSGLECVAPRSGHFALDLAPQTAANPGVFCDTVVGGVATRLGAVYFGASVTLDTAFAQALADIAGQAPHEDWPGEPSSFDKAPPAGAPHFRIARYTITSDGQPKYMRVAMSEARGWFMHQLVQGPIAEAEAIEAAAGEDWRRALVGFAKAPD
jgi:hypothetical protein